jgi:selenocysteine lyase/cysteine desulfurase
MTGARYAPGREAAAYDDFVRRFPAFASTAAVDVLRATDYERLDRLGHVYLDYTGGGLYAASQVRRHQELLHESVLGNPHSQNPTSLASSELAKGAREAVRRFFNAPEDEFEVVFTANASGALKLVGEAYPFAPGGVYLLSYDNHNSVNGIREFAMRGGAAVSYIPVREGDLRLDEKRVRAALRGAGMGAQRSAGPGSSGGAADPGAAPAKLFAYPAQSNFSGVQHPLEWVAEARELGWHVMLDCAAFAPTNRVDAHAVCADFIPLSFYKLFGFPTGSGCLIARRAALAKLRRPWFAGGTITLASVQHEEWHRLAPGATGFEDGTIDYLGLPAVTIGLEHLERVGIDLIHARVEALTGWLLEELESLRHSDGAPLVRIFGPRGGQRRGATIALYFLDPSGRPYDVDDVEAAAACELISVRSGCFCNPGDGEVAHRITRDDIERCFADPEAAITLSQCQRAIEDATGKVPNTIRVSLGLASNFADVHRFMAFAERYRDRRTA